MAMSFLNRKRPAAEPEEGAPAEGGPVDLGSFREEPPKARRVKPQVLVAAGVGVGIFVLWGMFSGSPKRPAPVEEQQKKVEEEVSNQTKPQPAKPTFLDEVVRDTGKAKAAARVAPTLPGAPGEPVAGAVGAEVGPGGREYAAVGTGAKAAPGPAGAARDSAPRDEQAQRRRQAYEQALEAPAIVETEAGKALGSVRAGIWQQPLKAMSRVAEASSEKAAEQPPQTYAEAEARARAQAMQETAAMYPQGVAGATPVAAPDPSAPYVQGGMSDAARERASRSGAEVYVPRSSGGRKSAKGSSSSGGQER